MPELDCGAAPGIGGIGRTPAAGGAPPQSCLRRHLGLAARDPGDTGAGHPREAQVGASEAGPTFGLTQGC